MYCNLASLVCHHTHGLSDYHFTGTMYTKTNHIMCLFLIEMKPINFSASDKYPDTLHLIILLGLASVSYKCHVFRRLHCSPIDDHFVRVYLDYSKVRDLMKISLPYI